MPDKINADAKDNCCAHCRRPIVAGDRVMLYVEPNESKNGNEIKIMIHDHCLEDFTGGHRLQ